MVKLAKHTSLLLYLVAGADPANAGVAFLPGSDQGDQLELDTAQAQAGFFVFWSGGTPNDADLALIGELLLTARQSASDENRGQIQFYRSGTEAAPVVTMIAAGTPPVLVQQTVEPRTTDNVILTRAHDLLVARSVIEVDGEALRFEPTGSGQHSLVHTGADLTLDELVMPLTGTLAGAFTGGTRIQPADIEGNDFVSEVTKRGLLGDDGTGTPIYFMDRERYPLVRGGGLDGTVAIELKAVLDPQDALNRDRTHFAVLENQTLVSAFRTTHGHKVLLSHNRPGDETPRFSYVRRRDRQPVSGEITFGPLNLMLEGDFDVALANDDDTPAEFPESGFGIVIAETQHDYLEASPASGGFAKAPPILSFLRGAAHVGEPDAALKISATASVEERDDLVAADGTSDQTSWVRLVPPGGNGAVVAEARDVRRLRSSANFAAGLSTLKHDPFRLVRTKESKSSIKPMGYVPVLPRAPGTGFVAGGSALSSELSIQRRKMLTVRHSEAFASASASTSTRTPLGFELVEEAGGVVKVVLARTEGGVSAELSMSSFKDGEPLPRPIVDALVRNRLFMVINYPDGGLASEHFKLSGTLQLSGWGFDFDLLGQWVKVEKKEREYIPVVVVKGFDGLTVRELFSKPQLWSGTGYLRSLDGGPGIDFAQKRFAASVKQAEGSDDPMYKPFLQAIDDVNWTGVIVLDVPLNIGILPDQVKGLLGGIDSARLKAHHLAVPVKRLEGGDADGLSKPFAAIDYVADERPVGYADIDPGDFDGPGQAPNKSDGEVGKPPVFAMKVKNLRVGFNNGTIQSFFCRLDLTIGSFFHDMGIELKDKDDKPIDPKVVTLVGRWQSRVVDGKRLETYDFFTETVFVIKMSDGFPLLKTATVSRMSYVTEVTQQADRDLVSSKFLIDGTLTFKELGSFDFLDVKDVKFTGLSLDLRFLAFKEGKIGFPRFRFSPGALIFDLDMSELKDGARGFFGSLPIKFSGFGWLGDVVTLPKLGYFSLGKSSGGGATAPFFLKFDLDLGSLGSFASALAKFKMELGLVFGLDGHNHPHWDLGFRFAGGGGKDLDIGVEGFLQFTCERYDVVTLKAKGSDQTYFGFRGVNARLTVFGTPLPPEEDNANIFLFVDPANLGGSKGIGWFLAYSHDGGGDIIDLRTLALGQRIDPLPTLPAGFLTTRKVVEELANMAKGVEEHDGKPYEIPTVKFSPDRGWTIGFHALIYRFIELGFALRDPDLAGILLDVKLTEGSDQSLFSVDILYRKLTDDLGVYSIEIVLPPSLRNWQFGAVGITLPYIGVEIYTDGNWGIDLGFPANKDFSRSFAISVFPFVGAGGFYFRRVSGPAAKRIPGRLGYDPGGGVVEADPKDLRYDPVTEIGLGLRVGLGVVVAQGILNAGLSLTVYGYLEGSFGKLYNRDPQLFPTGAKGSYIVVSGAVGVMGELYGYVDFGIIKAGVFIQLYVEVGFRLETDRATELYYEVGVRVSVRVVIASFKVFGKRIEIAISFSFNATVRFSQRIGHDESRQYYLGPTAFAMFAVPRQSLRSAMMWDIVPSPADWAGLAGTIRLEVAIQPDVTVARGNAGQEAHAVFLMVAELVDGAEPSAPERLIEGLTAWAVCAGIDGMTPATLGSIKLTAKDLQDLSERLAGLADGKPRYAQIVKFLQTGFVTEAQPLKTDGEQPEKAPNGAVLPFPDTLKIARARPATGGGESVDEIVFADYRFFDHAYRDELAQAFERFVIATSKDRAGSSEMLAEPGQSLVSALFEEWALMVMRAGVQHLAQIARTNESADGTSATELLALLVKRLDTAEADTSVRSEAAQIAVMASRFFNYGQRLPHPAQADAAMLPAWLEPLERPSGPDIPADQRFFHAMLRLGGQQMPIGDATRFEVVAGTYDGWLTVPAGVATEVVPGTPDAVLAAAAALVLPGTIERGPLHKQRRRYVPIGTAEASVTVDQGGTPQKLWLFGKEVRAVAAVATAAPQIYVADPSNPDKRDFRPLTVPTGGRIRPAIVIDVALRRPGGEADTAAKDAFEIKAIPEPLRNLIDPFAPVSDGGAGDLPDIEWVALFKQGGDVATLEPVGATAGQLATIVQSNLSVEVKPDIKMFAAARGRIEPVADVLKPLDFVRLLRQAAIVNTGGYHLSYAGASDELGPLFEASDGGKPADGGARVRVVIALADHPAAFARANAVLTSGLPLAEQSVLAVDAGDTFDPLHEPGIVPLVVRRPVIGLAPLEEGLSERFSNLALRVEVWGPDGKQVGLPQELDQSVPVGPDVRELDDEGQEILPENEKVYRVSVPALRIAGKGTDSTYDLIGGKIAVRGGWRDLYGNAWREPFAALDIGLVYSDRLLGLTGLPYVKAAFWPDTKPRALKLGLRSDYDPLIRLDGTTLPDSESVPPAWADATRNDLERSIAMLARAAMQLADARVALTLHSALGKPLSLQKDELVAHLQQTAEKLSMAKDIIGRTYKDRAAMRQAVQDAFVGLDHRVILPLQFAADNGPEFAEFKLELSIKRPAPAEHPELFEDLFQSETADAAARKNSLSEIHTVQETISPNLRGSASGEASSFSMDEDLGRGDAAELVAALAAIATEQRVATGYGADDSGTTEKAIWLIKRTYFDGVTGDNLYKDHAPIAVALPPLANRAYSHSFENLQAPDGTKRRWEVRDADADGYGRDCLARLERLLSPAIAVPLLNINDTAKRDAVRQAIEDLLDTKDGLAETLSQRLSVVFQQDEDDYGAIAVSRRARVEKAVADVMKRDLRSHYKVTSLLAYFDADIQEMPPLTRLGHGVVVQDDPGIRMTSYNLPLPLDGDAVSRDLIVLCEAKPDPGRGGRLPDHYPPPERFNLTHIQRLPRPDVSQAGVSYRNTAWLNLQDPAQSGWTSIKLPVAGVVVPNPLRRLPRTPVLANEGYRPTEYVDSADPAANLSAARRWTSLRDFQWEGEENDRLAVEVHYARRARAKALAENEDLVTRIVRFVLESDGQMAAIEAGDHAAYSWVAQRAKDVLLAAQADTEAFAASREMPSDRITLREFIDSGITKVEATGIALVSQDVAYHAVKEDGLGDPVVFANGDDDSALALPDALSDAGMKNRRLETRGLDILAFASARTELNLSRNELIEKRPLMDGFVYRLPRIGSGEDIVPSLDLTTTVTAGRFDPNNGDSIMAALEVFLKGLLAEDESEVLCAADVVFEYETGLFGGPSGEQGGPVITVASGISSKDSAKELSELIAGWFSAERPARNKGRCIGSVIADARVYVTNGFDEVSKDRRILRVRRCRFTLDG